MRPGPSASGPLRRRREPSLERLETRDLLSVVPSLAARGRPPERLAPLAALGDSNPPGRPTPHEVARRAFVAKFDGPFVTGPGRTTAQAFQSLLQGGGTSNMFLHGNLLMGLFVPKDPAEPITGLAMLVVKNVSDTGDLLLLDLQGDATSFDRQGRPTHLTWTVNGGSGGTFTDAEGEGTVEIRYRPGGRLPRRASAAGQAGVMFYGQISTTGVTNIVRAFLH